MRHDALAKLETYGETRRAWLDQAILALGAEITARPNLVARIAWALAHAHQRGQHGLPSPDPVDWLTHRYNQYVVPAYPIMRLAGQTIPEGVVSLAEDPQVPPPTPTRPPPVKRILRRHP